MQNNMFSTQVI